MDVVTEKREDQRQSSEKMISDACQIIIQRDGEPTFRECYFLNLAVSRILSGQYDAAKIEIKMALASRSEEIIIPKDYEPVSFSAVLEKIENLEWTKTEPYQNY